LSFAATVKAKSPPVKARNFPRRGIAIAETLEIKMDFEFVD